MTASWLEISRSRIRHNVDAVRQHVGPGTDIIAVVKADSYGMGKTFAATLVEAGVARFAVASAAEGAALRRVAPQAEILVLGGYEEAVREAFESARLTAAVFDGRPVPDSIPIHVKVNTGMNRLGLSSVAARDRVRRSGSQVQAVFSHLASAASDPDYTRLQLDRFLEATAGLDLPRHLANSAGLAFSRARLEAVRVGLALHGLDQGCGLGLEPAMTWKTRVMAVQEVGEGEPIGYRGTFTTRRPSRVAVLPVGYADGWPRALSERGVVGVGSGFAPLVGQVSMDLTSVDVTEIEGVGTGSVVTLISQRGTQRNSLQALSDAAGLIPWEMLTAVGSRVERRWTD